MYMHALTRLLTLLLATIAFSACNNTDDSATPSTESLSANESAPQAELITPHATEETRALYRNLKKIAPDTLMFGHEDTSAYGVEWWTDGTDRSDIKDITGSYPAIHGSDLGGLDLGWDKNLDDVRFEDYQRWIIDAYKRGGINTISWHMYDPITEGNSWAKTDTVSKLLPGAEGHERFIAVLDRFVEFNESLKAQNEDGSETWVPILFRPWHEHNGDWFWWGKGHTSEADYIALWRLTVEYLRDEKKQSNLIWAFSPDRSRMNPHNTPEGYLYAYPGDDYVDMLGLDNYWDLGHPANDAGMEERMTKFVESLEMLTDLAEQKGKVSALTEGGQANLPEQGFWTEQIIQHVFANEKTRRISYFLVWRNANPTLYPGTEYFAPYPEHSTAADFLKFYQDPRVFFESDLPAMYR